MGKKVYVNQRLKNEQNATKTNDLFRGKNCIKLKQIAMKRGY